MRWRREVLGHVFEQRPTDQLMKANENYYRRHLADGTHLAYIAVAESDDATECDDEKGGVEVGCGSLCFTEELPSPDNPSGRCAYLMNIYVRSPYRHHGAGAAIVRKLVDEARARGCDKIYLETTNDGRGVYEAMGFRDMPDMMKFYGKHD